MWPWLAGLVGMVGMAGMAGYNGDIFARRYRWIEPFFLTQRRSASSHNSGNIYILL